jgi:hypothetical protein
MMGDVIRIDRHADDEPCSLLYIDSFTMDNGHDS